MNSSFPFGIEIIVSPYLDKPVYRQARVHHKRRIHKKWRKRFGLKFSHMVSVGRYQMGNKLFVGRVDYEALKRDFPTLRA